MLVTRKESLGLWTACRLVIPGESYFRWSQASPANPSLRFFIHTSIQAFARDIIASHGQLGQQAMLFPSQGAARRCLDFVRQRANVTVAAGLDSVHLGLDVSRDVSPMMRDLNPTVSAVLYSPEALPITKQYWQHTGDGVSSRRAEFCHDLFNEGLLVPVAAVAAVARAQSPTESATKTCRGPRRYQRPSSVDSAVVIPKYSNGQASTYESQESVRFLEERFGRNLDLSLVQKAKSAIRRRIAGAVSTNVDLSNLNFPRMEFNSRGIANLQEEDVYLYPCGMNAIFNTHRCLLQARGPMKSINFGFPYVDTLKILEKFGPGCVFYGNASSTDLDGLEKRLLNGERFLGLFCEFPGNPLLTCPDLQRIRRLADQYDFALIVDESIGTFANVNVLPYADVVVSSLTKIFSGDCNVMGGGAILNPNGRYYNAMKLVLEWQYEDNYWPEDVIFMERNSRDFKSRIARINENSESICEALIASSLVKRVYYPKYSESRSNFEACRLSSGGYGGLLSVTFHDPTHAMAFYDSLETAKGPSLGTNFTLTSPYVLLAHYQERDWAEGFGVEPDLIRVSVGLEETEELRGIFEKALTSATRKATS
jgi:cystathionine gamma-synthase